MRYLQVRFVWTGNVVCVALPDIVQYWCWVVFVYICDTLLRCSTGGLQGIVRRCIAVGVLACIPGAVESRVEQVQQFSSVALWVKLQTTVDVLCAVALAHPKWSSSGRILPGTHYNAYLAMRPPKCPRRYFLFICFALVVHSVCQPSRVSK